MSTVAQPTSGKANGAVEIGITAEMSSEQASTVVANALEDYFWRSCRAANAETNEKISDREVRSTT
jgi:hypothetical protein